MMALSFVGLIAYSILIALLQIGRASNVNVAQIAKSEPAPVSSIEKEQLQSITANVEKRQRRQRRGAYGGGWAGGAPAFSYSNLLVSSEPPSRYTQNWIVSEHNRYRRMVPATNMRMIYWSDELARSAQMHADTCDFRHSRNRVNIGENIWAAPYYNYSDAIFRWFDEVNDPRCACNHAYKHCCGHYIQVVWADSNLVGCGYARCHDVLGVLGNGHRAVFVCHYSPQGNRVYVGSGQLIAVPAFSWAYSKDQRCSACPPDAPACHEGLCYMPLNYKPPQTAAQAAKSAAEDKSINTNSVLHV